MKVCAKRERFPSRKIRENGDLRHASAVGLASKKEI